MKGFTVVAVAAGLTASFVSAQLNNIPPCALSCAATSLPASCGISDVKCICSDTSFITSLTPCVQQACTSAEFQQTIQAAQALCASAGVTLSIPGGATSTSSSASASSSSSASVSVTSTSSSASKVSSSVSSVSSSVSSSSSESATKVATSSSAVATTITTSAKSSTSSSGNSSTPIATSSKPPAPTSSSSSAGRNTIVVGGFGVILAFVAALL